MKNLGFIAALSIAVGLAGTLNTPAEERLFNGKDLAGWETFLHGSNRADPDYGTNRDPEKVFSVASVDGQPAIRISGQYWGGMLTTKAYENYHLHLEFKWGQKRWPPRANVVRDSGLLYHCVGPDASSPNCPWPRSIEFNITEHDTGEFWSVDNTIVEAEVVAVGDSPREREEFKGWCARNDATGPKVRFKAGATKKTFHDGGFMPGGDYEKPVGQWNQLDLYTVGDSALHLVNGNVALVLTGLRQTVDGREKPLTKGRIELQSESAEIFFRNIWLEPIDSMPRNLLK